MRPGSAPFRTAGQILPRAAPLAASALLLSACATMVGPTVPVQPSPGKSPLAFRGDHAACMASTTARVQPVADRGTNGTAAIQGMFNAAYGACMAARGNVVLAAAPAMAPATAPAGGGMGAGGLSDPDSLAARRSLGAVIDGFRRDCDGERIAVTVTEAALSPAVEARMVELTTPGGRQLLRPAREQRLPRRQGERRLAPAAQRRARLHHRAEHPARRLRRPGAELARRLHLHLPLDRQPLRPGWLARLRHRRAADPRHPVPRGPGAVTEPSELTAVRPGRRHAGSANHPQPNRRCARGRAGRRSTGAALGASVRRPPPGPPGGGGAATRGARAPVQGIQSIQGA